MKNVFKLIFIGGSGFLLSGCLASERDMGTLKLQLKELNDSITVMQANQAELATKMEDLNRNLSVSSENLAQMDAQMVRLSTKLDDLSAVVRPGASSAGEISQQPAGQNVSSAPAARVPARPSQPQPQSQPQGQPQSQPQPMPSQSLQPQAQSQPQSQPQPQPQPKPVQEPAQPEAEQPAVPEEARPRQRKRRPASESPLSISAMMGEGEQRPALASSSASVADKPLPEDGFITGKWGELAAMYSSKPRLASTLSSSKLSVMSEEGKKILVFNVLNQAQKDWVESKLLHELEGRFRRIVGDDRIFLRVDLIPEEERPQTVYMPSEKAKDLMSKNEEVRNLVSDFGLDVK